jgi:hypothetical protein
MPHAIVFNSRSARERNATLRLGFPDVAQLGPTPAEKIAGAEKVRIIYLQF